MMLARIEMILQKLQNTHTLFVDDEGIILDAMQSVMPTLCKNVYFADNGHDGVCVARQHTIDMVITDISMPSMNGLEMVEVIREINPQVKVIYITGHSYEDLCDMQNQGQHQLIVKPISTKKLLSAIEKIF